MWSYLPHKTMADIPSIDTKAAADLVLLGQQRAIAVSGGRLSDFTPASPVMAILEATAIMAMQIQGTMNVLASTLENNRINLFNLERRVGVFSVGTVTVRLDGIYADVFFLPKGFKVYVGGMEFETVADFAIAPYVDSGNVDIIATQSGTRSNLPKSSIVAFTSLRRLGTIFLVDETKNGQDEETIEDFKERVYKLLRRRDTLLSEEDFETEVTDYLGLGSVALALGRLKPDQQTYDNGYVGVFALNPDGTQLSTAQLTQLSERLNKKAAMALVTLWSMDVNPIKVNIVAGLMPGQSPDAIATLVYQAVNIFLKPGYLPVGEPILPKALEARVQGILGIAEGVVSVTLNGLAMPCPLPNLWSVGKLDKLKITLITDRGRGSEINFNYPL